VRDEKRVAASGLRSTISRGDVLKMVGAATLGPNLLGASMSGGVADIAKFIGPIDAKHAGAGLAYDLGAVLPLTGPGAFYGRVQASGVKLAVAHIAALGGPNFNVIYKDGKGGDPQAGVQVTRELGLANVPAMLASYAADLGSMLTGIAQYKIFTLDGGGGTSLFAQGKPYFYGALAITPNDAMPGVARFIHEAMPRVKKVAALGWNLGPLNAPITADVNKWLESQHLVPGITELAKIGATDYSSSIEKLREDKPDLILVSVFRNKQAADHIHAHRIR
jgi:ABC-type branched-subunit amino acid transport system substrate-binding protein